MKKLLYFGAILITMVINIVLVNAGVLECSPTSVGTSDKVVCNVYSDTPDTVSNISISNGGVAESSVEAGSHVKMGSVTFTANSTRGSQTLAVTISGTKSDLSTFSDSAQTTIDVKSKAATLASVTVDNNKVTNNKITVDKETVNVAATAVSNATVVSGVGSKKLVCGANQIAIEVKAEAGNTAVTNITVTRNCDNNKTLKGLKISAKDKDGKSLAANLSPSFSSNTKEYKVELDSTAEKFSISATKQNDKQKVSGEVTDKVLDYGENKFALTVTSENGDTETYTIIVDRKDERGANAFLKSLKLSDGKLKFKKNTLDYTTKVLYDVTSIDVKALAEDEKAKVEITGNSNLKVGDNTIVVKVTSENEKEVKEYRIIVTRLKEGEVVGDNAYIRSLKIKGYDIKFDKEKLTYTIKIKDDKSLKLSIVMDEEGATYKVLNNNSLEDGSIVKIVTKSLDKEESLTYKINIEKDNKVLVFAIVGISFIVALALIIFFILRMKKGKTKNTDIKNEDIDNSLNLDRTMEYKADTRSSNYVNDVPANEDIILKINEMNNKPFSTREELRKSKIEKEESSDIDIYSSILTGSTVKKLREEQDILDNIREESSEAKEIATKVCSICGHKVASAATTCPYCKRTF